MPKFDIINVLPFFFSSDHYTTLENTTVLFLFKKIKETRRLKQAEA